CSHWATCCAVYTSGWCSSSKAIPCSCKSRRIHDGVAMSVPLSILSNQCNYLINEVGRDHGIAQATFQVSGMDEEYVKERYPARTEAVRLRSEARSIC